MKTFWIGAVLVMVSLGTLVVKRADENARWQVVQEKATPNGCFWIGSRNFSLVGQFEGYRVCPKPKPQYETW